MPVTSRPTGPPPAGVARLARAPVDCARNENEEAYCTRGGRAGPAGPRVSGRRGLEQEQRPRRTRIAQQAHACVAEPAPGAPLLAPGMRRAQRSCPAPLPGLVCNSTLVAASAGTAHTTAGQKLPQLSPHVRAVELTNASPSYW